MACELTWWQGVGKIDGRKVPWWQHKQAQQAQRSDRAGQSRERGENERSTDLVRVNVEGSPHNALHGPHDVVHDEYGPAPLGECHADVVHPVGASARPLKNLLKLSSQSCAPMNYEEAVHVS